MRERDRKPPRPGGAPRGQHPQRGRGRLPAERAAFGSPGRSPDDPVILYGWHTVIAALANPRRRIRRLYATENAARRLATEGVTPPVPPDLVRPDAIATRL